MNEHEQEARAETGTVFLSRKTYGQEGVNMI
jgi:hypothetical protein